MFFLEGWTPVARLFHSVRSLARDRFEDEACTASGLSRNDFDIYTYSDIYTKLLTATDESIIPPFWDYLSSVAEKGGIGVLLGNAEIVLCDKAIVQDADSSGTDGWVIDLTVGTIGSSGAFDHGAFWNGALPAFRDEEHLQALKVRYGPFVYCPVLIKEVFSEEYLKNHQKNLDEAFPPHKHVAEAIIADYDAERTVTKMAYRRSLGANMKAVEFEATWKMAVEKRPGLSRPGPRGPIRRNYYSIDPER